LRGSAAVRGLQFSLLPWIFNGLVLFPLLGAGPFAIALGTGLLPAAGELVRQGIFGASLGTLYRLIRFARQPRAHTGHRHGHRHSPGSPGASEVATLAGPITTNGTGERGERGHADGVGGATEMDGTNGRAPGASPVATPHA
jgi:hypothetical protein